MKRFLLTVSLLVVPFFMSVAADVEEGYYRVHNYKTNRYVYVCDNTGKVDYVALTADMGAIQLWKGHDRTYSDPASIIYLKKMGETSGGTYYNLYSQGTNVKQIIDHYVFLHYTSGYYQLYAEGKYLCDCETSSSEDGSMGIDKIADAYRRWIADKVDSKTDEWFGITPTVNADGRKLHPFYADFGFSCVPQDMKVWYVKVVDKEGAVIKEITDNVIPARVPVIIECTQENASDNRLDLTYSYDAGPNDNKLAGVYFNNRYRPSSPDARKVYDASTMRVLGVMSDGRPGFVLSTVTPDTKTNKQYLEANKSYLVVGPDIPDEIPLITEAEYEEILARRIEDSIAAVTPVAFEKNVASDVYMISGRSLGKLTREEIQQLPAGVYIIDNRKVVIK